MIALGSGSQQGGGGGVGGISFQLAKCTCGVRGATDGHTHSIPLSSRDMVGSDIQTRFVLGLVLQWRGDKTTMDRDGRSGDFREATVSC